MVARDMGIGGGEEWCVWWYGIRGIVGSGEEEFGEKI